MGETRHDDDEIVNVGWGKDISIMELAELIKKLIGYNGALALDTSYPDGTYQKLLDNSLINSLGWQPSIRLEEGISNAIEDFQLKWL